MPLFGGARLSLGVSMLLVITFAMRHSIIGVALADLLLLIEVHLISPNYFAHSMKLLHPIELHFFCLFEYIGAKRHPEMAKQTMKEFLVQVLINSLPSYMRSKVEAFDTKPEIKLCLLCR